METDNSVTKITSVDQWAEFWIGVETFEKKGLRKGQSMMNALHQVAPEVYKEIEGTEFDCFYVDARIEAFLNRVF